MYIDCRIKDDIGIFINLLMMHSDGERSCHEFQPRICLRLFKKCGIKRMVETEFEICPTRVLTVTVHMFPVPFDFSLIILFQQMAPKALSYDEVNFQAYLISPIYPFP